jgi:hypothetical protein
MREHSGDKLRMEHMSINNSTKTFSYPRGDFNPCGLYVQPSDERKVMVVQDRIYARLWETRLPDGSQSAIFLPVDGPQGGH